MRVGGRCIAALSPILFALAPELSAPSIPDNQPTGPSNLRLRVIWGAIAAAGLFGCTFAGPVTFGLFFATVQAIMLKEFYRIMRVEGLKPAFWIGIVISILLFGITWEAAWLRQPDGAFLPAIVSTFRVQLLVLGALLILLPTLLILREIQAWPREGKPTSPFLSIGATLLGLLYVSLPMALLNSIAFDDLGSYTPRHVFLLIFLIWAADTGAYFAGKAFGRHKLAPSISPGKTWEGWAGGAALTLAVGWAVGYFVPDVPLGHRLVAASVVAVFGPLGDLAESMLKRSAGVKDSGTFLPGHGGLLDRFDAFLLVLPMLALLQALAG